MDIRVTDGLLLEMSAKGASIIVYMTRQQEDTLRQIALDYQGRYLEDGLSEENGNDYVLSLDVKAVPMMHEGDVDIPQGIWFMYGASEGVRDMLRSAYDASLLIHYTDSVGSPVKMNIYTSKESLEPHAATVVHGPVFWNKMMQPIVLHRALRDRLQHFHDDTNEEDNT